MGGTAAIHEPHIPSLWFRSFAVFSDANSVSFVMKRKFFVRIVFFSSLNPPPFGHKWLLLQLNKFCWPIAKQPQIPLYEWDSVQPYKFAAVAVALCLYVHRNKNLRRLNGKIVMPLAQQKKCRDKLREVFHHFCAEIGDCCWHFDGCGCAACTIINIISNNSKPSMAEWNSIFSHNVYLIYFLIQTNTKITLQCLNRRLSSSIDIVWDCFILFYFLLRWLKLCYLRQSIERIAANIFSKTQNQQKHFNHQ